MKDNEGRKFVRSRLVASDFEEKSDRREELFPATPPLETLKALLTLAHRDGLSRVGCQERAPQWQSSARRWTVLRADAAGDWQLRICIYGLQLAARAWKEDYGERFRNEGMVRGVVAPTCVCFFCPARDDDVIAGPREHADRFLAKMRGHGTRHEGASDVGTREGRRASVMLVWRLRWCEFVGAVREDGVESGERVELDRREASRYRGRAARANYMVLAGMPQNGIN